MHEVKYTSLRLLKSRNFGLLWWSSFISEAGTWMQTVALGALVTDLTRSAAWGAAAAGVLFLLNGLCTPFAGVLADHYNKRHILAAGAVAQAILASVLAIVYVSGNASPGFILVNVALEGVFLAVSLPARGALLPDLVEREQLVHATALGTASWNLGRAAGPAFAGVIIAWGSYTWIFILNAVTFVIVAIAVALLRLRPHQHSVDPDGPLTRFRAGVHAVRTEPGCGLVIIVIAVTALIISPFIALIPAVSQLVFHGTAVDTAHFVMAQGVGAAIGAFVVGATTARFGHNRVIRATMVLLATSELAYALVPGKELAIFLLGFVGFFYSWMLILLNTIVQLRADPKFRGRAISIFWTSLSLFYPIGATVQGRLADSFGVRRVLSGGAGLMLLIVVVAMGIAWRRFDVLAPRAPARPWVDLGSSIDL